MSERLKRLLAAAAAAAAVVGGGWLALRFVLPCLAPFLLAGALAALSEPAVRALERLRVRRSAAAALVTLLELAGLTLLLSRLAARFLAAVNGFAASLPELMRALETRLGGLEARLLQAAEAAPGSAAYLEIALDAIAAALTELPPGLVRRLLNALTRLAQRSPDALLFTVTAALGSGFISASLPQLRAFFLAQLSEPQRLRLGELTADLRKNCGGWLRAQLQLLLITFFELLAALLILRVRRPVAAAALTALVDALPVFGVGAVLLPWAAIALLRGSTRLALGLTLSYGIISLVRNALQAKLLGDQIGLAPLPSLLSAYAGWKLCGVWGALLFPLLAVTLVQLNDRGVVRLWRDP